MIFPPKLKAGDEVRVVAPAKSFLPTFTEAMRSSAKKNLESLGLVVTFGDFVDEADELLSATVEHRLADLHNAFRDPNVKAILSVQGGSQSNQLLKLLDYDLIRANPKILCGMSDITALTNAMLKKTGLVTYSGPGFTLFKESTTVGYTLEYFRKALFSEEPIVVEPSLQYSDKRGTDDVRKNEGFWAMNPGEAQGILIGGNLITMNMLQGSEFMPDLSGSILCIEDNDKESNRAFANHLQSIINQPNFSGVQGIIIGRFQNGTQMSRELLGKILETKPELRRMPIIANVDFGHTVPTMTFPIGGKAVLKASSASSLEILTH
ncbi:MAG: S66 peptidase family protein [Patescibacteria group bacterium]